MAGKYLKGDKHYTWGSPKTNPPTSKQQYAIDIIYERLGIPFKGNYSDEAYEFISNHYNEAMLSNISYPQSVKDKTYKSYSWFQQTNEPKLTPTKNPLELEDGEDILDLEF